MSDVGDALLAGTVGALKQYALQEQEKKDAQEAALAEGARRGYERTKMYLGANLNAKPETIETVRDGKRGTLTTRPQFDPVTGQRTDVEIGFAPEKPEAPKSRTRREGASDVFEQWNPETGTFEELSRAPHWDPRGPGGGQAADKASNYQIVQGADGTNYRVNKLTGATEPVVTDSGTAVVGANSFKAQQAARAAPMAAAQVSGSVAQLDRLEQAASQLLDAPGLPRITGLMGTLPSIPGGDAADAEAQLDTLKSQVGFSVLQQMRDMSKTGGALGQVSDRENTMLQNNLETLQQSQSPEQMRAALQGLVEYAQGAKQRLRSAYNNTYGGGEVTEDLRSAPGPAANISGKGYVKINGQWYEQ